MLKNRLVSMPWLEKLAYCLAALVITTFVVVISFLVIDKSDALLHDVSLPAFYYINYLFAAGLNMLLLAGAFVESFEEISAVFYRRETSFLLQFSIGGFQYYVYKLICAALKIMPILILFFPFYMINIILIYHFFGWGGAFFFVLFTLMAAPLMLLFFASLALSFCVIIARLLAFFNQRALALLSVFFMALSICYYYPLFKTAIMAGDGAGKTRGMENIYNAVVAVEGIFKYFPASFFSGALNGFFKKEYLSSIFEMSYALLSISLAIAAGFFLLKFFLLKNLGCLMDCIFLRQGSDGSIGYFFPPRIVPPLWRAALIDETAHLIRQNLTLLVILTAPMFFALPFYLPPKFLAIIGGPNKGATGSWVVYLISSMIILQMKDLMTADINSKRFFLPLLRSLPVKMFDFIKIKIIFYFAVESVILSVIFAPWTYFWGFGARKLLELFAFTLLLSATSVVVCYGSVLFFAALFSMSKDSDGLKTLSPAVQILNFIFVAAFCGSLIWLNNKGFSQLYIIFYMSLWLAVFWYAFVKGVAMLDKREL